jgi:hypothetical protein
MKIAYLNTFVVGLTLAIGGCGADPSDAEDTLATSADSIERGSVDNGNPAVGMVWFQNNGFCTGVLIAPNVVMTAGHCATELPVAFTLGNGFATSDRVALRNSPSWRTFGVADRALPPGYFSSDECPRISPDVGLLRLTSNVTGVVPVQLGTAPVNGTQCNAVGFGNHYEANGSITFGRKRFAVESVLNSSFNNIHTRAVTGDDNRGDSGGPFLCGGKIAGVVSCSLKTADGRTIPETVYKARVDVLGWWTQSVLAQWR